MAAKLTTYPEHEKLSALGGANQIVGDFIEWLFEQGWEIAEWNSSGHRLSPIRKSRDTLIAEHFEINRDTLEDEKRAMLAALSQHQGGTDGR